MADGASLVNLGDLSKPATVLIEKISDAIGGIFKPWQIRRIAQAEGEAERFKAVAQIEISKLQRRALQRFITEEAKKQCNMEAITAKALPGLQNSAEPQKMDDDWIANFFDKCRLISNDEMQILWAKVLAGEANSPGSYSKRTVNFLGSLDRTDALLFQSLCGFSWIIGSVTPLIFSVDAEIYNRQGINFNTLKHLDEIGLLSFENLTGYIRKRLPKKFGILYCGEPMIIDFPNEKDNNLDIGKVLLSKTGQELAPICGAKAIPGFYDYVFSHWKGRGLTVTSSHDISQPKQSNTGSA
ncbi:MAG: hypothetical protein FD146_598 [Anaerolineaceae bacterium]|nr:MAG: hypothetical protein FD146_598 [Anaerolineaceae bacterium]